MSEDQAWKRDVSGSFTSDILLNAPDTLFDQLSLIFKSFLIHGTVSLQLLSCAFLPLFKVGLKNSESADSYRAIAASSQLLQLFDNVILLIWGHLLDSDSLQFGYKSGTSGTQCSWFVLEVAAWCGIFDHTVSETWGHVLTLFVHSAQHLNNKT